MKTIGIVNYGMGNLRSVCNAVSMVGGIPQILSNPSEISQCSHLILPGVGAFGDAMRNLTEMSWREPLHMHAIDFGKPFLGICLGMQLLAEHGTEHGAFEGLGWISGTVTKLSVTSNERIPHIGWNNVAFVGDPPLFNGLAQGCDFYFVHSYVLRPADERCVTSWCHHGERFAASIQSDNIFATQFHPEKSHSNGLRVLERFIAC